MRAPSPAPERCRISRWAWSTLHTGSPPWSNKIFSTNLRRLPTFTVILYIEHKFHKFGGVVRKYRPDFLIRLTNGTTLVLEVSAGNNRGCYQNADYARQYQIATTTLNAEEREQAIIEGMKVMTQDVAFIPLSYNTENIPVRKGLVGPGPRWPGQTGNTWSAYRWYWE